MNTIQRITKNVGVLFVSQMMSYVLGFFTLMYSARYLGVEGFGTLSLALAFTGIFSVFMDLGLSTLTIREVARDKGLAKDYIANVTLMKIFLGIITFLLIFIIVHALGYDQQTMEVVYLITIYTIFSAFSQLFYAVFQANETMEYSSLGTILINVLLLVGVLVAIYYNFSISSFASVYMIAGFITLIYSILIFSWKFFLPTMKFDKIKWIELMKEAWPFAISGISINIYIWIDTIILSIFKGSEAVGLYNASYKLILVLVAIPIVFDTAFFPIMSQYYISSKESLKFSFEKMFKIMMIMALPIGVGTLLIANKIIAIIYGDQFLGAVIALQILIWSNVLIFARTPFIRLIEASNQQLVVTKIFILGVIFNVLLNLVIIPHYSFIGASVVTVLTDILMLTLLFRVIKSYGFIFSKNTKISLIKIGLASLIMGFIIYCLLNLNLSLPLLVLIGILVYGAVVLLLKIFDEEEIAIIKSIFKSQD